MSALVPPMSTVMMSLMPQAAATSRAPTTPAAGPDSAVNAGARRMVTAARHAAVRTACRAAARPTFSSARRSSSARDVGRHARHHQRRSAPSPASARIRAPPAARRTRRSPRFRATPRADLGHAPLVHRVGEGVQQADRHRLDLEGAAGLGCGVHARFVQGLDDARRRRRCAPRPRARARPARDRRLHPGEVVGAPRDVLRGRSPARGGSRPSSPGRCARLCPPGSCWWRPSCRAARGPASVRRDPRLPGQAAPPARKACAGIGRHARRLGAPDLAALGVVQGDVGEGTADIDGDGERCISQGCRHSL